MKSLFITFAAIALVAANAIAQGKITKETATYAEKDGKEILLDKYIDNTFRSEGKHPAFIYVHGGGFAAGNRLNTQQNRYCKHFAEQGFVSITIDYRLGIPADNEMPENREPSHATIIKAVDMACEDLISATNYIISKAEEWNIDTSKIIISGSSAGAITCLTTEYWICNGDKRTDVLPKGFNYAGIISHAGSVIIPSGDFRWKKTPCPIMLMHGSVDQLVAFNLRNAPGMNQAGSNYLHKQFSEMNASHWFYEKIGADHIIAVTPLEYNFGEIDTFVRKFVMNGKQSIVHTKWEDATPNTMDDIRKLVPFLFEDDKTDTIQK
jgi:predicted esterase